MAPFEALYGRRCRTPLNWSQPGEIEIFGPDLVTEAETKVKLIRKNLEAAQARQKSYHDKRRKPLQFEVGDFIYLKVSPTKGVQRFGIKGKLAPRYIGPYEIVEACAPYEIVEACAANKWGLRVSGSSAGTGRPTQWQVDRANSKACGGRAGILTGVVCLLVTREKGRGVWRGEADNGPLVSGSLSTSRTCMVWAAMLMGRGDVGRWRAQRTTV
jgi:hypothetical protein